MNIEKVSEKIGQKDWKEVKNYWQNFLYLLEFPLSELDYSEDFKYTLKNIASEIKELEEKSSIRDHYFQIDGIQIKSFSDSIILFYKGLNAIKSAQCDQLSGYKTWSINNYYQSSYFTIKSLMNLLGVCYLRTEDNIDLLIDLLPHYKKISKAQFLRNRAAHECQIQIVKQLEHWQNWRILQKVIRYLKNPPFNNGFFKLFNFPPKTYAKHRNNIIYYNNIWSFHDLKYEIFDRDYGLVNFDEIDIDTIVNDEYFTIIIAYQLLFILFGLFQELSDNNPHFKMEFEIMENSIIHESNSNYKRFVDQNFN